MSFLGKVYSEGYCCLYGYLRLCRARGETPKGMSENIDLGKPSIIRHHYRRLDKGFHACEKRGDCMKDVIDEIEKAP